MVGRCTKGDAGVVVRIPVVKGFPSRITFQILSRHAAGDCCEEFSYVVLYFSMDVGDKRPAGQIELHGNSQAYRLALRPRPAPQLDLSN